MPALKRPMAWLAVLALLLLSTAGDASARGGGGGGMGGGRGGFGGGGRGGFSGRGGAMRAAAAARAGGNAGRGGTGFGMRGTRTGDRSAKEWEVLQSIEERKLAIQSRRERLMDLDRKQRQEAFLAQARTARALVLGKPVAGLPGSAR